MSASAKGQFIHRHNPDGTVESICVKCFVTLATERREENLEYAEKLHICDPWLLERYRAARRED